MKIKGDSPQNLCTKLLLAFLWEFIEAVDKFHGNSIKEYVMKARHNIVCNDRGVREFLNGQNLQSVGRATDFFFQTELGKTGKSIKVFHP